MSTYYVATTGSDSTADGTNIATPYRTIQKACNQLSAGDTLYIRGGTYNEQIRMTHSGESGSRITISGYTGETVIIDGEYALPKGTYGYFFTNNPKNEKVGPDLWRLKTTGDLNHEFAFAKLVTIDANYVTIKDLRITRARGQAIGSTVATVGNTVQNVQMWDMRHFAVYFYAGTSYLTLDGCDIRRTGNFAPFLRGAGDLNWGACVSFSACHHGTMKNCTIYDAWNEGITVGYDSDVIEDNIIANTLSTFLYLQKSNNCTVQRNLIYAVPGTALGDLTRGRAGITIGIEPWGTPNPGVKCNGNYVANNIVVGTPTGFAWRPKKMNSGAATEMKNNIVVNNTFISPRTTRIEQGSPAAAPCMYWGGDEASQSGNEIRNNIFYIGTGASAGATLTSGASRSGYTFSNNLWQGGTPPAWVQGSGDVSGGSGLYRPNATLLNRPLGTEAYQPGAVANNYFISDSGSSAIDAGTATNAPSDDYAGSTRTGTVDIGAHEYGATSIPSGVTADFTASTTSGTGELTVQFFDASSGTPTSWSWEYKESADSAYTWFSAAENPVRTFDAGTYSIRLTVSDADTSDTKTRTGYIVIAQDTGDSGTGTPGGGTGVSISTSAIDTTATSTGDQDIAFNNADLTPNASILFFCGAESNGTARDEAAIGVGFTDGTNSYATGTAAEHSSATTQNDTVTRTDAIVAMMNPGTLSQRAKANHSSFGAGSETINWSQVYATSFLMAGLGLVATNVAAGVCTPHATANSSITIAPGFTPDLIIFVHTGTNAPATANDWRIGLGFAVNGGNQVSAAWRYDDDDAAQTNAARLATDRAGLASTVGGAVQNAIEVTAWGSTTTVTSRDTGNSGGNEVFWLALELENGVYCGVIDTPTSTGNQSYTGVGFKPGAILAVGTMIQTAASAITDADAGSFGFGLWANDGGEQSLTAQVENGVGTTNTQSYGNTKIMDLPIDDGGAGITASMVSADADGFTLNFSATLGSARKWLVLALEDGSLFIPDFVKVGTTRGMFAGMP